MARYGIKKSEEMEHAIKVLRAGQSRGQQNQALLDKVMMHGAQAGLMGANGVYQATKSDEAKEEREYARAAEASRAALRTAPRVPNAPPVQDPQADEYGLHTDPLTRANSERSYEDEMNNSVAAGAKAAQARLGMNASAELSTIGGYSTPNGRRNDQDQSDMLTRDISTANDGMQHGGMMNSLSRMRPPNEGY